MDLDLLLCTGFDSEHAVLFLSPSHISTRDQWLIKRLSEAMGAALVSNNFSPIPSKNFISHQKKVLIAAATPEIYKALKPCWLLNWVSIARVVACFPQASLSLPAATAADSETPCVCARLSDPRKQSRRAAPRAWPLILPSKPSITFWNSLRRDCQMTCRGSNLNSNLNSAAWPTSCKDFISSEITAWTVWSLSSF